MPLNTLSLHTHSTPHPPSGHADMACLPLERATTSAGLEGSAEASPPQDNRSPATSSDGLNPSIIQLVLGLIREGRCTKMNLHVLAGTRGVCLGLDSEASLKLDKQEFVEFEPFFQDMGFN